MKIIDKIKVYLSNKKDKFNICLSNKKSLRFYDILSIVLISYYLEKFSNENITLESIDINKTILYMLSGLFIVSFYILYQYIRDMNEEVIKAQARKEEGFDYSKTLLEQIKTKTNAKRIKIVKIILALSLALFIITLLCK